MDVDIAAPAPVYLVQHATAAVAQTFPTLRYDRTIGFDHSIRIGCVFNLLPAKVLPHFSTTPRRVCTTERAKLCAPPPLAPVPAASCAHLAPAQATPEASPPPRARTSPPSAAPPLPGCSAQQSSAPPRAPAAE